MKVIKRDGTTVDFDAAKIVVAIHSRQRTVSTLRLQVLIYHHAVLMSIVSPALKAIIHNLYKEKNRPAEAESARYRAFCALLPSSVFTKAENCAKIRGI